MSDRISEGSGNYHCDKHDPDYDYGILFTQQMTLVNSEMVLVAGHAFYKRPVHETVWHRQHEHVQQICATSGVTEYYFMLEYGYSSPPYCAASDLSAARGGSPRAASGLLYEAVNDWNIFVCRNQTSAVLAMQTSSTPFTLGDNAALANADGLESAYVKVEEFDSLPGKNGDIYEVIVLRLKKKIFNRGAYRSTASWTNPEFAENPRFISDPEMEVSLKPF